MLIITNHTNATTVANFNTINLLQDEENIVFRILQYYILD